MPLVLRTVQEPINFLGVECKEDTTVGLLIWLLHTHPEIWDQPHTFVPERFAIKSMSLFEYCPFGGGFKKCLGSHFALMEMKSILTAILTSCDLQLIETSLPKTKVSGLVFGTKKPVYVLLQKR